MTDEETEQQRQLSIQAATDLLELLLRRGYLHENVVPILGDADRGNPQRDGQSPSYFSTDDSSCEVVMLLKGDKNGNGSCCCTYPALKQALETELSVHGGRASFSEIITVLKLQNEKPLLRIVEQHRDHRRYFQVGNDILSVTYLEDQCQKVFDSLLSTTENGFSLVSDIANQRFHLPMGITLEALEERLPDEVQILHLEAGTAIATRNYLYDLNGKVFEAFQELQEPALVSDICQSHHWDNALVAPWVQSFCQDGKLSGDFHGGGSPDVSAKSILIGAMYTPHAHTQQQRKAVDDLFSTQGYLTATRGVALGLSKSKMGEYVQEQFVSHYCDIYLLLYLIVQITNSLFINRSLLL